MQRRFAWACIAGSVLLGTAAAVMAQRDFSSVEIKSQKLAEGVYMLTGAGGNIGVCTGPEGVLLVDDQYAPLAPKIQAALKGIADQPLRMVLNTHWHGDHTGGNETFAKAGALLLAQENVRQRMSTTQTISADSKVDPSPAAALPVVTFQDGIIVHLNGEELEVTHLANAHTDGDAVVWFRKAKVLHTGDIFFNGIYPRIDCPSGGSIDGMIAATETLLGKIGPDTQVIPGHGPLGDRAALQAYHDMLSGARAAVAQAAQGGKTLADVQAAKPTAAWDTVWGNGFIKPDKFVEFVYTGVTAKKK